MKISFGLAIFQYPRAAHKRRHGPWGYDDYKSYKPWLRDDFSFRCVFCLVRERWCPDGANGFGVDHLVPKSSTSELLCDYENLLYVCNRCNSAKRISAVLDPCQVALGDYLQTSDDGSVMATNKEGEHVIDVFNLNYSMTRAYRLRKIEAFSRWHSIGDTWTIQEELAYPDDLPDLHAKRCNNYRPGGLHQSFFAQRNRGVLSATY